MSGSDRRTVKRLSASLKASYAWTPALTAGVGVMPNWTWSKLDTNAFLPFGPFGGLQPNFVCRKTGQTCRPQGESNFIGTEWNVALTYSIAPGLVFDWDSATYRLTALWLIGT